MLFELLGRIVAISALSCCLASGDELVHLASGFTLQAECHIQRSNSVEISTGGGTVELPMDQIQSIEVLSPVESAKKAAIPSNAPEKRPDMVISEAATAQGIDAAFVRSVATIESGLRQSSLSVKGAVGLMQLMPGTAKDLGVNPSIPEQNAAGGAQYLRTLLLRYKGNSALALAAYNAGPGAITKYKGIPPYRETQRYVTLVLREYERQRRLVAVPNKRGLPQLASGKTASKPTATD